MSSPSSPVSARHGANGSPLRKRSFAMADIKADPEGSDDDDDHDVPGHERKRQPGVKRACNECRQQKLRCDVQQDPIFQSCSRCNRLKLECKIESNFKRVGKRSRHAEMEKEIALLRRQMAEAKAQGFVVEEDEDLPSPITQEYQSLTHTRHPSLMGSDDVVSSLLNLRRGDSYRYHKLENVRLTDEAVQQLFAEFFAHYHPFLPFLNPDQTPDQYYQQHPLLFWAIISIAARRYAHDRSLFSVLSEPLRNLLWKTISEVPNTHFIVKALCLLCTWPLPTSISTSDPTHVLCGIMMKCATGIGLHRPSHSQDFSRVSVELNKEQLHDRVITWAVCNIVAQSIGTGYGQPAATLYDFTLAVRPGEDGPFTLPPELEARLQIERFCDKVSKEMYSNAKDPRGVAGDDHRAIIMRVYRREFNEIQAAILSRSLSPIVEVHLQAAGLHLRLAGFFDSTETPSYMDDLMGLWKATTAFLEAVFDSDTNPFENHAVLRYSTNYVKQMIIAAGFALLKLLQSFFRKTIDYERGRRLLHRTVDAIRASSVMENDLEWRLAELMVQMWNGSRRNLGGGQTSSYPSDDAALLMDDSLQLKVRCRHSMSHVYDSIWRWREEFQAQGRGTLDSLKPTNPDSGAMSSASSAHHVDAPSLLPAHTLSANLLQSTPRALTPGLPSATASNGLNIGLGFQETNYDFFDPHNWNLDGLMDFNFAFMPSIESTS